MIDFKPNLHIYDGVVAHIFALKPVCHQRIYTGFNLLGERSYPWRCVGGVTVFIVGTGGPQSGARRDFAAALPFAKYSDSALMS